jgi:predicted RND superfamily exporter protein
MLIYILIIFFIILIFYQIFLAYINSKMNTIEGMESQDYKPYDLNNPNNTLILAQQNAGNIQVLKKQMDDLLHLNDEVQDISGNVATLTTNVSNLIEQQQQYVQTNLPSSPPQITGTGTTTSTTTTT